MQTYKRPEEGHASSPIWDKALKQALDRFRSNLYPENDIDEILERGTLSSCSALVESISVVTTKESTATSSIRRLEPILKALDDMSAVAALSFGAGTTMTALLWGSLRVFIMLASSASDILQQVLDMLEDLANRLPQLKRYEETIRLGSQMERSLLELYTEIICFYARAIKFLRSHPHARLRRHAWSELRHDFSRTMLTINRMANKVDSDAELAKMRMNQEHNKEVIECIQSEQSSRAIMPLSTLTCNVPASMNQLFQGREDILVQLQGSLASEELEDELKIAVIHGMGGVGKTQIAREFIRRSYKQFSAIFWIQASSTTALIQSFETCARQIALNDSEQKPINPNDSIAETLKWVYETGSRCLFVFDNVEDSNMLQCAWPKCSLGSILITCRSFSIVSAVSATAYEVLPFDEDASVEYLFKVAPHTQRDAETVEAAKKLSELCGGLPLALLQVGTFGAVRRLRLPKVLTMYKRSSDAINNKKSTATDYEHTVGTLWDLPLSRLTGDAAVLQRILSMFQPDSIDEKLLQEAATDCKEDRLSFISDDMSFGDAEEILFEENLVRKDIDNDSLSMHRLIQTATRKRMTQEEKSYFTMCVVELLSSSFPDTWSADMGHQHSSWDRASRTIAHAVHLSELIQESNDEALIADRVKYGELLLRCSWYLYERELYDIGLQLVQISRDFLKDDMTLAYASAIDLSGLMKLDLHHPAEAMPFFKEAFDIRKLVLGPDDVFLASSLNNIAMAQMEMGELDLSVATHNKALDMRRQHANDRIGNSLSNLASLLLRMEKFDEAEATLRSCPSLQAFTDEEFLKTENPRFVGDLILLSRIRVGQGRVDEALRLAAKALNFRRRVHGNRYKTCDGMILVAKLLHWSARPASAIELLSEVTQVASTLPAGQGYAARAHYWLSKIFGSMGDESRREEHQQLALRMRLESGASTADVSFEEASFETLTPFMLW